MKNAITTLTWLLIKLSHKVVITSRDDGFAQINYAIKIFRLLSSQLSRQYAKTKNLIASNRIKFSTIFKPLMHTHYLPTQSAFIIFIPHPVLCWLSCWFDVHSHPLAYTNFKSYFKRFCASQVVPFKSNDCLCFSLTWNSSMLQCGVGKFLNVVWIECELFGILSNLSWNSISLHSLWLKLHKH